MLEIPIENKKNAIWVQVVPKDIDVCNKIIEAYGHLALVTTVDAQQGILAVWVTEDTRKATEKLLTKLPVACTILKN